MRILAKITVGGAALAIAAILGLAGGGSTDSASSSDKPLVVEVKAQAIKFNPDQIRIPTGRQVTIRLRNLDAMEHDLQIQALEPIGLTGGGHGASSGHPGGAVAVHTQAKKSGEVTFLVTKPGTYEVICTLPGHKELGMVGTLVAS